MTAHVAHVLVVAPAGSSSAAPWLTAFPASIAVEAVAPADVAEALGRIDAPSIGVVALGPAGEPAVHAAAADGRVAAIVVCDAPRSAAISELITRWPEVAVFAAADPNDRDALTGAVDAYLASPHPASDLAVGPQAADSVRNAVGWLSARLAAVATVDEIVLTTTDGWEIHGTLWRPRASGWLPRDGTAGGVPGVVLLHSGRSDRAVFARLERLLAERGMAVLNIDWRGRGRSINRGTYFDLDQEERAAGWRDAAAAVDHLAGLPDVGPELIAAVGVVHGAEHAVRAAVRDRRVRAVVLLTGYQPADDAERDLLVGGALDVLYVTSRDHTITTAAMRALHDATPPDRSRFVEYPGGAIGYQLFELDHGLEPAIVDWLTDVLARRQTLR